MEHSSSAFGSGGAVGGLGGTANNTGGEFSETILFLVW
jgi:hypothetical protein